MKRIRAIDGDVFRPKGQLERDLELARNSPMEVVRILMPRLSDERRLRIEDVVASRTNMLAVAVEGVRDPHNTAAVIRTADAFGVLNVHIIEGESRFKSSRKVTLGAHKWVDISIWRGPDTFVRRMERDGRRILVADIKGSTDLYSLRALKEPMVLVFGNEREGISEEMARSAQGAFRIPMFGFVESLNVSVAAGIAMGFLTSGGEGDLSKKEALVLTARYCLRAVRAGYDIVMREKCE